MKRADLITAAQNTWCPGCGNFVIEHTLKDIIGELIEAGTPAEEIVLVTGIGCHAKMADYLHVNSVYTIHGRVLPVATGLKIARPDLTVIGCAGDGDTYAEGISHLVFAAKRNMDITLVVHDNRVFGLTTGQYTPTSPQGFRGRSTPGGSVEPPINPIGVVRAAGGTFIARGYTRRRDHLRSVLHEAVRHHGFSFVEVLQICATFFDMTRVYDRLVFEVSGHDPEDPRQADERIREWDYRSDDAPIPLGILYRCRRETFDDAMGLHAGGGGDREDAIARALDDLI